MFEVGKVYKRITEIHGVYGGQAQGGISTPKNYPFIFIFTSDAGEKHGYKDEFVDGLFWYTGEGQIGDMAMTKGNKAILNHAKDEKQIHVFEYAKKAHVRYMGSGECLGFITQIRPDRGDKPRKVFIFQLDIDSSPKHEYKRSPTKTIGIEESKPKSLDKLENLRKAALNVPLHNSSKEEKKRSAYIRAEAIKKYVLARANGICEGCSLPAPFMTSKGPYLECHHLFRLVDGGPDHPENVIALCPNCHREAHYSLKKEDFNSEMKLVIRNKEFR